MFNQHKAFTVGIWSVDSKWQVSYRDLRAENMVTDLKSMKTINNINRLLNIMSPQWLTCERDWCQDVSVVNRSSLVADVSCWLDEMYNIRCGRSATWKCQSRNDPRSRIHQPHARSGISSTMQRMPSTRGWSLGSWSHPMRRLAAVGMTKTSVIRSLRGQIWPFEVKGIASSRHDLVRVAPTGNVA